MLIRPFLNIVAGIKCLESIVQSKSTTVLPQQAGRTHLRIAEGKIQNYKINYTYILCYNL